MSTGAQAHRQAALRRPWRVFEASVFLQGVAANAGRQDRQTSRSGRAESAGKYPQRESKNGPLSCECGRVGSGRVGEEAGRSGVELGVVMAAVAAAVASPLRAHGTACNRVRVLTS